MQRLKLSVGNLVMVSEFRPDGQPHPHAGKTGVIVRLLDPNDEERENLSSNEPKFGMVKLDDGRPPNNLICVSLECLEGYKLTHVERHDWQTMSDEEFAEWFRNLKLKALDATESKRLRKPAQAINAKRQEIPRFKMTEGRREPKSCSFCGRPQDVFLPMITSASGSASVCLYCIMRFQPPYAWGTEQKRRLEQAKALCVPPSRWKKISNG
jgi:hypothetical protein